MSYVIGVIVVVAAIVAYASLTGLPDHSGKARSDVVTDTNDTRLARRFTLDINRYKNL